MDLPMMRAFIVKHIRIIVVYRKLVKYDWSEATMSLIRSMTSTDHVSRSTCVSSNSVFHCFIV